MRTSIEGLAAALTIIPEVRVIASARPRETTAPGWTEQMARAKAGDRGALMQVLERALPSVFRLISYRLGPGNSTIEDATQETLIAAMTSIAKFKGHGEGDFRRWVYGIARFKATDQLRSALSAQRTMDAARLSERLPFDHFDQVLDNHFLKSALEKLPKDQRETLVLRFVVGHSLEEVAEIMRKTVGAIKSLQHRGLGTLAAQLREGR